MKRTLVGYAVAYAAFEGTAQLAGSLDLAWRQLVIAAAPYLMFALPPRSPTTAQAERASPP